MLSSRELTARIRTLFIDRLELPLDPADLDPGAALMEEVGLDSAAILEVVAEIEEEFGIEIDTDEVSEDNFQSIESLARFVATKL